MVGVGLGGLMMMPREVGRVLISRLHFLPRRLPQVYVGFRVGCRFPLEIDLWTRGRAFFVQLGRLGWIRL